MRNNGFVKVACITPKIEIANPIFNVEEMLKQIYIANEENCNFILFPELSVTGYTCQDLFFQSYLLKGVEDNINHLLQNNKFDGILMIGAPIEIMGKLYNCGIVIHKDKILGIIPKTYLPNTGEFYEKRWFNLGSDIIKSINKIDYIYKDVPFGKIVFHEKSKDVRFGVEVCEDMWAPISPGNLLALNGAEIIFNLSASNEVLNKDYERKNTILSHSTRNVGAYVYCSAGVFESTTDTVFSGHNLIASLGYPIEEAEIFNRESSILYADIDLNKIKYKRRQSTTLKDSFKDMHFKYNFIDVDTEFNDDNYKFVREIDKTPFIPKTNLKSSFEKILNIQTTGLAKRLEHTKTNTVVIGISGGLDSTLALLVAVNTFDKLKLDRKNIHAITIPGFGTSKRTNINALRLMESLGVTLKEYDLTQSVLEHFKTIEHDPKDIDVTFENAQARERTNILMNLANKYRGIELGTGDLSELALGWCTYNGDHMSMYSINSGLPKTLVKFMVKGFADFLCENKSFVSDEYKNVLKETLYDILDTPISPELTGEEQKTEDIIGKYEVHDFIIHRMLVCGDDENRIRYLLKKAFEELSDEEIDEYVTLFYRRFFSQQFKRSALPDGPKVIDISLSPRADWRMPSDAKYTR